MEKRALDISWASLWRIFAFLIFAVIVFQGKQIVLGLFLALVISSGLEFIVDFLERRGMPRTLGVISIFLGSILAFVVVIYLIVPFVVADLNSLLINLQKSPLVFWLSPLVNEITTQSLSAFVNQISTQLFTMDSTSAFETASQIAGSFGLGIAVIIISFYLSLSRDGIERFIKAVLPGAYEGYVLRVYERSRRKIASWFRTQILLTMAMGLSVWLALFLLGVKHAFLVGLIAGAFELMPFVGPILSGGVAMIFASATSTALVLYTLIFFLILHQIEANVLVPLLTRRSLGLHPVIVITSLLIGIELGGLLGAVIAVPAAAVIQEVVEEWSATKGSQASATIG